MEQTVSRHTGRTAKAVGEMGDLLTLPGMNPERVQRLMDRLQVSNRAELKRALAAGKVVGLEGFSRELKSRLQAALAAEPDGS